MSLLEFNDVTKIFKADIFGAQFKALDELSFTVDESSLVGFLGANGAGKTTSVKIIMNFIKKDSGEINFSKELGKNRSEILSNIGFFPERPYFYPYLTGREFLEYMGTLNNLSKHQIKKASEYWGERFKISFAFDRKITSYSKGMLQRLGFTSCLIHDPKLLILDEPLSGLDPIGRKEFKDVMTELKSEGKTVFFSSHIVSDVEEVCEKVVVIEKGKLVYNGPIASVLSQDDKLMYEISLKGDLNNQLAPFLKDKNQDVSILEIPLEEKNRILDEIHNSDLELISLHRQKLSLEEFVYKVRK